MFKEIVETKVLVPLDRMELFEHKIAQINKKLFKLKVPELKIRYEGNADIPCQSSDHNAVRVGGKWIRPSARFLVSGWLPIFDGWKFVARIDFEVGKSPVVFSLEPFDVNKIPQTAHCEHCKHKRQRNSVIIVEKDGVEKQIGSTCVKDFLGHDDLLRILNLWRDATDGLTGTEYDDVVPHRFSNFQSVMVVLGRVSSAIRQFGYVTRANSSASGRTATADQAFNTKLEVTPEDWETAEKVLAWYDAEWRNKTNPKTDFESNVIAAIHDNNTVHQRMVGIVAWLPHGYAKSLQPKVDKVASKPSDYLNPAPTYKLTPISKKPIVGNFGPMTVVRMQDPDGNVAVWFASANTDFLVVGEEVEVKLSIKKMEEYNGKKQTVVTHVKKV